MATLRKINSFGKKNKSTLLKWAGFRTINKAMKETGLNETDTLEYIADIYNSFIDEEKTKAKQVKKDEKNKEKQFVLNNVTIVKNKPEGEDALTDLKRELRNKIGKSVVVEYISHGTLFRSVQYTVPNDFRRWWQQANVRGDFMYDSDIFVWDAEPGGKLVIYDQNIGINSTKVIQYFKEGITNCLLTPILNWAKEKLEEAKADRTIDRYKKIVKDTNEFMNEFTNGVPENEIPRICNKLQVDITIELPFCENKLVEVKSIKKRLRHFKYINSRLDHIDLNEIVGDNKPIEVSRKNLLEIKEKLDKNETYYTYKKDIHSINAINTLTEQYRIGNDYNEAINEFELETGLKYCRIDDFNDAELSKFVRSGTHFNETVDFQICDIDLFCHNEMTENGNIQKYCDLKHIDMKKAYASFKTCSFYEGFLGKITDFRKTNKIEEVGMYQITDIVITNEKFKQYNDKMKIYLNNNVYPSPELKMLDELGVTYKIICGCWGIGNLDFDFNERMLESRDDENTPFYSKWTGMCFMKKLEKNFWMKCNEDYVGLIKTICEEGTVKYYNNGEMQVCIPKKHNYHLSHVAAFITSYMRINVIDQLMAMEYDNIVRICVDGIYYTGDDVECYNCFRNKDGFTFGNSAGDYYCSNIEDYLEFSCGEERQHFKKEIHTGEGGCGKTHYNCNDKGLCRPLFLSPSWKLARCKQNETGINCSVWARALTDDPEQISWIRERANVLIIDEVSMLNEEDKNKFFSLYSNMKIIMCGDLGYQLPPVTGKEMNTQGFDNKIKHAKDFRCKDPKLKHIKQILRGMIEYDRPRKEINDWVVKEFKSIGRTISVEDLNKHYRIEDMILTGTKKIQEYLTSLFVGKFEKEKYYIKENNRIYCNGDIVIQEKEPIKTSYEIQHSFTTHSIQGETAQHKLFIDSSRMFDSRMFYTAISRAKTLDQIFIIIPDEKINDIIRSSTKVFIRKKVE